ncbi:MAG: F0F1 ATP synthase subunit delta [Candidatus Uhrbacteria bacterium]|nr:F0F1 ATP synthase subunit delta [Candidatus Uhrbacteria bacterium]
MKVDAKKLAKILVDSVDGANESEANKIIKDFVKFLAENKLLGMWREIERGIHSSWKEKYGASQVTIVSAHRLSIDARDVITGLAKGADIHETVNERLIGGTIIRIDDTRIDGSISGALDKLQRELTA